MSVRGIRIWRRNDARFQPSILVEKNGLEGSLLFQGGAVATLGESSSVATQHDPTGPSDSDSTEVERRSYQKIVDSYGLLGVLAITKDESVLLAVTGVLSVGQLYGADILKITNVEFISLRTFGSVENVDSRIVDVSSLLSIPFIPHF